MKKNNIKICLACSAGGHLSEMLQLELFYGKHEHFFVTFEREDSGSLAKKEKVLFIERPARSPIATIKSLIQAKEIMGKEKPDIVLSTGADAGLMACIAAKMQGCKVVFIESFCRPVKPGISGRIAYLFADLFVYQWKDLKKYYPKGVFGGSIFSANMGGARRQKEDGKIFLTVGTHPQGFDRLVRKIDDMVDRGEIREKVFGQIGCTNYSPKNFEFKKFLGLDEFNEKMHESSLVITHAGEGNIGLALQLGKKMVVVPRLKRFGEHTNDHQLELAEKIREEDLAIVVSNVNELGNAISLAREAKPKAIGGGKIVQILEDFTVSMFGE